MRLQPVLLAVLIVLAVALIATVVLDTAAPMADACEHAKDSASHGLLLAAQKNYMKILTEDPTSTCATNGMKVVVRKLCWRAGRLAEVDPEGARNAYQAMLRGDLPVSGQCAVTGLRGHPVVPAGKEASP